MATQTMFGRRMQHITFAVHALPYSRCPNVVVAYPDLDDWIWLYDRNFTRSPSNQGELFNDMKRGHERSVTKQLDEIYKRSTGRAVLAAIKSRPTHSVMILPFDFLNSRHWSPGTGAVASPTDAAAAHLGVQMCGRSVDGKPFCFAGTGKGTGSSVDIFFTASRFKKTPDDSLLHELLHASRHVNGVRYRMPMSGGYGNQEEFLAVIVENMYRSEKGEKLLYDYRGTRIDAVRFLDDPKLRPSPRAVLALMRSNQPALFSTLARLEATVTPFNPFRQVDAEHSALMRKIQNS